ncbi:hypothetical protein BRADI_3g43286v3 [Brachypodium distachyon]|uniref:Uncharacterized protein n=1 Tax=Brachypodium distachyon TaxID=15368 RepID=A0A2K2D2V4_BRADI|nr:hypothetical protein BRADI_3g43286v3 [Brachypodium distachyon]
MVVGDRLCFLVLGEFWKDLMAVLDCHVDHNYSYVIRNICYGLFVFSIEACAWHFAIVENMTDMLWYK